MTRGEGTRPRLAYPEDRSEYRTHVPTDMWGMRWEHRIDPRSLLPPAAWLRSARQTAQLQTAAPSYPRHRSILFPKGNYLEPVSHKDIKIIHNPAMIFNHLVVSHSSEWIKLQFDQQLHCSLCASHLAVQGGAHHSSLHSRRPHCRTSRGHLWSPTKALSQPDLPSLTQDGIFYEALPTQLTLLFRMYLERLCAGLWGTSYEIKILILWKELQLAFLTREKSVANRMGLNTEKDSYS